MVAATTSSPFAEVFDVHQVRTLLSRVIEIMTGVDVGRVVHIRPARKELVRVTDGL
jgi:hypothetical protein